MRHARIIMGMPVSVDIVGTPPPEIFEKVFDYFVWVDNTFSTYKAESEISRINAGTLKIENADPKVQEVFKLCEETKTLTDGYFNIYKKDGSCDPSGLVKGWAIHQAGLILKEAGHDHFFIEAGGDIQTAGKNHDGNAWRVGIRDPFNKDALSRIVSLENGEGIATSGTYERGQHIYDPKTGEVVTDNAGLTIIGPNIYEADRFATAAFAMNDMTLDFIGSLKDFAVPFEGYLVTAKGEEKETDGFSQYVIK